MNLQKKTWTHGLTLQDFEEHTSTNAKVSAATCSRALSVAVKAGRRCGQQAAKLLQES